MFVFYRIYPFCYSYDERAGYLVLLVVFCPASFAALAIDAAACNTSKV
jgi:hypothetical protein